MRSEGDGREHQGNGGVHGVVDGDIGSMVM